MTRKNVPDMKDKKAYTKWLMEVWPGNCAYKKHGCFGCDIEQEFLVPFLCEHHYIEWLIDPKQFELVADQLEQNEIFD